MPTAAGPSLPNGAQLNYFCTLQPIYQLCADFHADLPSPDRDTVLLYALTPFCSSTIIKKRLYTSNIPMCQTNFNPYV